MKTVFLFLLSFAIITMGACQKEVVDNEEMKTIRLNEKSSRLVEADNAFGLELFQQIRAESEAENIMISPLSISVALAMAYNGAEGETRDEMEETLRLNGLTAAEINASYEMLIEALQSLDDEVIFEIANAIYYAEGFSVKPGFLELNETVYDAKVESLNFSAPSAVETINSWVAEKTRDKIPQIIEQLNPLDRMVLLNAIYFNGIWSQQFDEEGTHKLDFIKSEEVTLKVPMMNKREELEYTANDLFKAIRMPYGNGQYNMVVFLPVNAHHSQDVIDAFSASNWKNWMGSFESTERVEVTMPRFKFSFETGLNNVLKKMGMEKAFLADLADFSGITEEDLYISTVKHKSFIDVNETGTEAAAVTGIVFTTTSIENDPPVPFFVDRPFVFAITESDTNAILFIGEVKHPEYNE